MNECQNYKVKRTWSKQSQISEHNNILNIWDTGSHIYERWPNGNEIYWKIISREETKSGFLEILEQMPQWQMPGQIVRQEQIPLLEVSPSEFHLGSWAIQQEVCREQIQEHQQGQQMQQKEPYPKQEQQRGRQVIQQGQQREQQGGQRIQGGRQGRQQKYSKGLTVGKVNSQIIPPSGGNTGEKQGNLEKATSSLVVQLP